MERADATKEDHPCANGGDTSADESCSEDTIEQEGVGNGTIASVVRGAKNRPATHILVQLVLDMDFDDDAAGTSRTTAVYSSRVVCEL